MRKKIVALLLQLIAIMAIGQQKTISLPLQSKELLETSKSQKLIGHIFLIGGFTSIVTAFVYPQGKEIITTSSGIFGGGPPTVNSHHENDGVKSTFGLVGILVSLISIPFYLGAERIKKKATSLSFISCTIFKNQSSLNSYLIIPPNTFFKISDVLAIGLALMFASSFATWSNKASTAFPTT